VGVARPPSRAAPLFFPSRLLSPRLVRPFAPQLLRAQHQARRPVRVVFCRISVVTASRASSDVPFSSNLFFSPSSSSHYYFRRFVYYITTVINAIAALAYLVMALGGSEMSNPRGQSVAVIARGFLWVRYADWASACSINTSCCPSLALPTQFL